VAEPPGALTSLLPELDTFLLEDSFRLFVYNFPLAKCNHGNLVSCNTSDVDENTEK